MRPLRCGPILICLSVLSAFSADRDLDGIWQSEGYGNVFKIQGTHIESFQFTTTTCVKGPAAYFIGASGSARNSEGDLFTIRDGDFADYKLLQPIGSAGEIRLGRISTLPSVCNQLTANTPAANFEVFARNFAEHYISLDLKHVNWDTLTEHARGVITPATSPTKLFEIMKGLIEPFGDGHTGIDASAIHREFEGFRPGGYQLTEGKAEEEFIKHKMPIIWGITDRFLSAKPRNFANGQIAYGRVGKNIGYLRILAMGGSLRANMACSVITTRRSVSSMLARRGRGRSPYSRIHSGYDPFRCRPPLPRPRPPHQLRRQRCDWSCHRLPVRDYRLSRLHQTGA